MIHVLDPTDQDLDAELRLGLFLRTDKRRLVDARTPERRNEAADRPDLVDDEPLGPLVVVHPPLVFLRVEVALNEQIDIFRLAVLDLELGVQVRPAHELLGRLLADESALVEILNHLLASSRIARQIRRGRDGDRKVTVLYLGIAPALLANDVLAGPCHHEVCIVCR